MFQLSKKNKREFVEESWRKEEYIEELMMQIDTHVRQLVDVFRFVLKYRILFRGSGVEFASLREYVPGQDDAIRIDWKASLRANKLYIRQYEEERDLDVYILLDSSSSMLLGTQEKLKSEYAAIVCGAIAYAAIESGDNVGFGMFNDKILFSLEPAGDMTQYYKILRHVVDPQYYGGKCNLGESLNYLINVLQSRTILFIISDFIGLDKNWSDSLKMMGGKLDRIIGIMSRDIRDSKLPENLGYMKFKDPFSDKMMTVDVDNIRDEYNYLAEKQEKNIENEFQGVGLGFVKVYTTEPFVEPLIRYLTIEW